MKLAGSWPVSWATSSSVSGVMLAVVVAPGVATECNTMPPSAALATASRHAGKRAVVIVMCSCRWSRWSRAWPRCRWRIWLSTRTGQRGTLGHHAGQGDRGGGACARTGVPSDEPPPQATSRPAIDMAVLANANSSREGVVFMGVPLSLLVNGRLGAPKQAASQSPMPRPILGNRMYLLYPPFGGLPPAVACAASDAIIPT